MDDDGRVALRGGIGWQEEKVECDCSLMISVSIRIAWLNQSCEIGVRKSWDWPLPGNVRGFESFIEGGKNV